MSPLARLVAIASLMGCGGSPPPAVAPVEVPLDGALASWASDLFPTRLEAPARIDRYGRHVALLYGGRVYASNGDDMPSQIMAALYPALFHADGLADRRVALIGIGSGVELTVLLRVGARVDLYEPDARLLENAEVIASEFGLAFTGEAGRRAPEHERLRIVRGPADAGSEAVRYDAIVHANANTVTSRPPSLYTVERFERLRALLAPGGILGVHLQLYEIRRDMYQRLAATFASACPHVAVMSAEDLSSDSYLYGSAAELAMRVPTLDRLFADGELAAIRERAVWHRRLDPAVRALFRDRAELLGYAAGADPFTDAAPLALADWPVREEHLPPPEGDPSSLDDEWAAWEERHAAWTRASGFEDGFVAQFYATDFRTGEPCVEGARCPLLDRVAATDLVDLARSHLAHGQTERAMRRVEAAAGPNDSAAELRRVLGPMQALLAALLSDREPPVAIAALLGPSIARSPALEAAWRRTERNRGAWDDASRDLARSAGASEAARDALAGIAALRSGSTAIARRDLAYAAADAELVERFPAVLFFHARAAWQENDYDAAVVSMERYLAAEPISR